MCNNSFYLFQQNNCLHAFFRVRSIHQRKHRPAGSYNLKQVQFYVHWCLEVTLNTLVKLFKVTSNRPDAVRRSGLWARAIANNIPPLSFVFVCIHQLDTKMASDTAMLCKKNRMFWHNFYLVYCFMGEYFNVSKKTI